MSKKVNPTAIGSFVLLGIILIAIGTIVFSSANLFSPQARFVLYFDASVNGLDVGSPVKFSGVKIGEVQEIGLDLGENLEAIEVPVVIRINCDLLQSKTGRTVDLTSPVIINQLIKSGLRGQLETESLITGRLYVNLQVLTNAPPPQLDTETWSTLPAIPTLPSNISALFNNLAQLDAKGLVDRINILLDETHAVFQKIRVNDIQGTVTNLLASATALVESKELKNVLVSAERALNGFEGVMKELEPQVGPLATNVNTTLKEATVAMEELRESISGLRESANPNAPLMRQLIDSLESMDQAARAVNDLAEFLRRNPNSLISGRKQ